MKKLFILVLSTLFLSVGSIASADPIDTFTSSLTYEGFAAYATNHDGGPAFGPLYGFMYAEYYGDYNLPVDLSMEYDWTLSYNFHAEGVYTSGDSWNPFDYNVSRSFNLGQFALGDSPNPVTAGRAVIESLDPYGYSPGIGGYIHSGDWNHGVVLAGLTLPVGDVENAFVAFNGDVQLTATSPVPEPATMLLFGTGLIGLAGARFRRKK